METVGQLIGDGLAVTGRTCGAIIERSIRAVFPVSSPPAESNSTEAVTTLTAVAVPSTHPHVVCIPADLVHDGFLAVSGLFWLTGRLPSTSWHAITNRGKTAACRNEELYLGSASNWFTMINQFTLSTSALLTPIPLYLAFQSAFTGVRLITTTHPPASPQYPQENWYFINGVATDDNWLSKNLIHLETRFGQPVTGVSNGTCGLPTDLLTCLLQRNMCWTTQAVHQLVNRIAYDIHRTDKRIRILAHSQGTLILQLALEQIYKQTDKDKRNKVMNRLYIHTFASCAKDYPDHGYGAIEHYANEKDGVSKLGVLDGIYRIRHAGQVYVHEGVSGHLLNTSYSLQANDYTPSPASPALLSLPTVSIPVTTTAALLAARANGITSISNGSTRGAPAFHDAPPTTPVRIRVSAPPITPSNDVPEAPVFGNDAPAPPPMDAPPMAPSFDGVPPPPGPPPPPAPPAPMITPTKNARADLLAQIQAGKALKKSSPGPSTPGGAPVPASPNGKPSPGGAPPASPAAMTVQQQMAMVLAKRNAAKQAKQ